MTESTADSLTIIGFGLIGGSIAKAARERALAQRITAVDVEAVLDQSAAQRHADRLIDARDGAGLHRAVAGAGLVVLSAPVGVIEEQMVRVLEAARLVTDCGSTKRAIVRAAERCTRRGRFVAGHPMAGRPEGGIAQARADLFSGRTWILCEQGSDADAIEKVEHFVGALGARPLRMSAEAHDRAVALTSHVPRLLATVLSNLASDRQAWDAAGPAFESATRVAGGAEAMWKDIFETNADEVVSALRAVCLELEAIAAGLDAEPADLAPALERLERARGRRL